MTEIKTCPLCGIAPRIAMKYGCFRLKCPGCGDCAEHYRGDVHQAIDEWNEGITPEYIREVAE